MGPDKGESWHWEATTQEWRKGLDQAGQASTIYKRHQRSSALVPINLHHILNLQTHLDLKTDHTMAWQIQCEEFVGCVDRFRWSGNFLPLNAV